MRGLKWLPLLIITAIGLRFAMVALVSRVEPTPSFPPPLVPKGMTVLSMTPGADEQCYAHTVAALSNADQAKSETWARALDLPCADDVKPCTSWSTERRASPFWKGDHGEPQGLDTVVATLDGGTLIVDWGDYLCSGWN